MKRRRRKNLHNSVRKISMALCIAAAVAAVGAAAFRVKKVPVESGTLSSSTDEHNDVADLSSDPTSSSEPPSVSSKDKDNNKKPTLNLPDKSTLPANTLPIDEYDDNEDSEQTMAIQTVANPSSYVRAVGGAVTKEYSMSSLVYSRTMGDWRVHNGIDMSANSGEIVKSASEGIVTGVQDNSMYGTVITVNQNDGLMVNYCGLSNDTAVKVGDKVSAGTTLGTVGDIPCESGDGCHVHIEVMREKKYLNPSELLGYR